MGEIEFTLPSTRALASWEKSLRRLRPVSVWLRYCVLHRVEAQVNVSDIPPLKQFDRLVLEAFAMTLTQGSTLSLDDTIDSVSRDLHVEPGLLRQLLTRFERAELIRQTENALEITELGSACVSNGRAPAYIQQRRSFYFEEPAEADLEVRFLPLTRPATQAYSPQESWTFSTSHLEKCLTQSKQWKEEHSFPTEVLSLSRLKSAEVSDSARADWQRVILDAPQECMLLLLLNDQGEFQGFNIQLDSWKLYTNNPVLRLGQSWNEVFPELKQETSAELWKESWIEWGQSENLPLKEVQECEVKQVGAQIQIAPSDYLFGILKKSRSPLLKGGVWLLAGEGQSRQLAQARSVKHIQE